MTRHKRDGLYRCSAETPVRRRMSYTAYHPDAEEIGIEIDPRLGIVIQWRCPHCGEEFREAAPELMARNWE